MSKRLQVLIDEPELEEIRAAAQRERLTVAEWVRKSLREVRRNQPIGDVRIKLERVRAASAHRFPTGDIDQMLAEIEAGYGASERR